MEDETDESIWRRVTDGDTQAFGLIWDRHREAVQWHLRHHTDPSTREDLTAIVFLELWRRRARVRFVDGSLRPWLLVTATNTQRNAARSARRYRSLLASLPKPAESDQLPVTPQEVIHEALGDISAVDQQLLLLRSEGYSLREAGERLGISEGAAKMRLSRLRAKARDMHRPIPTTPARRI